MWCLYSLSGSCWLAVQKSCTFTAPFLQIRVGRFFLLWYWVPKIRAIGYFLDKVSADGVRVTVFCRRLIGPLYFETLSQRRGQPWMTWTSTLANLTEDDPDLQRHRAANP